MSVFLHRALLERLATDIYVLIAPEEAHRPRSMPCCWVFWYQSTGVAGWHSPWASPLCETDCQHNNHRHEVLAYPMLAPTTQQKVVR